MGGGFVDDEQPLLPNGQKGPWQILDGVLNHCGFGRTQTQLFILCALVNFIEAMVTALIPLLFPLLKKEWQVDNAQLALLGSAISIGMLIGALLLGKSSDIIGRKISMLICLVTILVFGFGSAFAPSMSVMAGLQLLLGVGYGGNIVISTTYLCEFLPKKC
jgi:MFS family permease